jgi:hypothetical protein
MIDTTFLKVNALYWPIKEDQDEHFCRRWSIQKVMSFMYVGSEHKVCYSVLQINVMLFLLVSSYIGFQYLNGTLCVFA